MAWKFFLIKQETAQQGGKEDQEIVTAAIIDSVIDLISEEKDQDAFIRLQVKALLAGFYLETGKGESGAFLAKLNEILVKTVDREGKIEIWHSVISLMRKRMIGIFTAKIDFILAEDLWQQARIMISETADRFKDSLYLKRHNKKNVLRDIGAKLITIYDIKALMDILAVSLPRLESGYPKLLSLTI